MLRMRRRDRLIAQMARQLADKSAENAALTERLEWYKAAMAERPVLRVVPPQAVRSEALRTSR